DLEPRLRHGPLFDGVEDFAQPRQACGRGRVIRVGLPLGLADHIADPFPHRRLRDEIDVRIRIALPAFAFQNPARLTATRIIAGAWHRLPERNTFAVLAVFRERPMLEPLLIAQFYPREIEDPILHGGEHALSAAGAHALVECADNPECEVQASAGIANLRPRYERRAVAEPR